MTRQAIVATLILTVRAAQTPAQTVAFEDVNVIPMDREQVLQNQTVVVQEGRITAVGPSKKVKMPSDAVRVNGKGKFLMPGLAEMHGHLPPPNTPRTVVENVLFLYVANGVTTVRGMLGDSRHLELRQEISDRKLLGPKLYVAGPAFSGQSAPTAEVARKMVRDQKSAGFDHLKIQEGLKREVYDAIVEEARAAGISFAGHVPNEVGVHHALEVRQKSIDHLDNYIDGVESDNSPVRNAEPPIRARQLPAHLDERKIQPLAEKTRESGVWTVPTMALWEVFNSSESAESLLRRPELKYMPRQTVDQWSAAKQKMLANVDPKIGTMDLEFRKKMLGALHKAGAKIALGTDSPQVFSVPGFSIHREMPIMVACGMKPYDVLVSGTRNVAEYFGTLKESGTVAVGKHADLILLEADPLANVANIVRRAGVMIAGKWLPESEIQARLEKIASAR
jgi:imidazolonepropionase-like amidohydrolase